MASNPIKRKSICNGGSGQPIDATNARALVWQLAQEAAQANSSQALTLAALSAEVTRSAARILGMSEDDLVRLLRDHPPH